LLIAASYWYNSALNALADQDRLEEITKKVNGGTFGLEDRKRWAELALKLLGVK
jgi:putative chitinase